MRWAIAGDIFLKMAFQITGKMPIIPDTAWADLSANSLRKAAALQP
jgi:hypothetical protein